jgi:hypothetical protein
MLLAILLARGNYRLQQLNIDGAGFAGFRVRLNRNVDARAGF